MLKYASLIDQFEFKTIIIMQNVSVNSFIDYFKLFKVFELKKIEKTGLVKIIQDKTLNRKIVSVEGNISTSNFITLQTHNFPNMPFSERYLYIQAFLDPGKSFCFQVAYTLANKLFKAVYSTLYKTPKKHLENIVHLPLNLPNSKWTIAVIDLYELGLHFAFKPQEMKMIFRINSVEIRASSKVKGIFQSDYLYSIDKMPKDINFPMKKQQSFFEKYHYFVETTDPTSLKCAEEFKDIQKQLQLRKEVKEQKSQSTTRLKQSKSIENEKLLSISRNKKSLQKAKNSEKIAEKQQKCSTKKPNSKLPPRKKQQKSTKHIPKQQQFEQNEVEQQQIQPPKPQSMMVVHLSCIEGFSLNSGQLMAVQSYLSYPTYMPLHKPVQTLTSCDQAYMKIVTGYNDGSICMWDTIHKTPLFYFMTELAQIKIILTDSKYNLILIGLDKLKRQVINIISEGSVVFRQISNFNISAALLISKKSFEYGLVTFGFENIRLWRINNQKSIIQGASIYMGQTNRKVKYTSGLVIPTKQDNLVYISDSNGFITAISIAESKMIQSIKLDNCCIDQMMLLYDGRAIICNQQGVIKIVNLDRMQVHEEYSLNSRIKDIQQLQSEEIVITHYNKSIGLLNLESSMYSFTMRSHTSLITKIAYNPHLNKVISISKDNSIRIWQYVVQSEGPFQYRLQEQYQFVITGEQMVDVVCGAEGRLQQLKKVMVGGDSGKIRVINIEKYEIQNEVIIQKGPMSLSISRNGRYLLCTYSSGNSYLLDPNLTIIYKYIAGQSSRKKIKNLQNGFNRVNKQYYIQNISDEKLQFYSLKDQSSPLYSIKFNEKTMTSISYIGSKVYIIDDELKVYDKGVMMQVISVDSISRHDTNRYLCLEFPLLCCAMGQKLLVKVLTTSLQQQIQLPQAVNSISIHYSAQKQDGLIICSGRISYSIYVFTFQLHNVGQDITQLILTSKIQQQEHEDQLEISFSNKTTYSAYNKQEANQRNSQLQEAPKELKPLYAKEEQLYQEVKQYLFPKSFQQNLNNEENQDDPAQEENQADSKELCILLNYGYELRQNCKNENDIGNFYWLPESNSLILVTGCQKSIMQHFFSVPIKHRVINFPSALTSLCISQRSYENLRYLCVCVNGLIKIYNIYSQVSFIRNIDTISNAFIGIVIFQSYISNCNRYIVTLSFNNINFDNKLYIHLVQLSSGNVVSSSYLSLPEPKNKYKKSQIKDAKEYSMVLNPYKNGLQFVIYHPQGLLYFYRVTSIFTLQTMQLQQLISLCRDKISNISCACFISVGQSAFEDAVLAIGTENGSLVFVDCRTSNIMIACVGVLSTPILSISYSKSHHQEQEKLILFTNSTLITVFNLFHGLNSILISMEESTKQGDPTVQIKRIMTLDGEVSSKSNVESNGQQMMLTKTGSLWLLDYQDFVTVKVSTIHTMPINKAEVIIGSAKQSFLLTCSDDGSAKLSNFSNLQQIFEIYRPRKQSKCLNISGNLTLLSFGDEICIYSKIDASIIDSQSQISSLGSFKLDGTVLAIQNIPSTDNYYVLTQTEVFVIYVQIKSKNKKSQLSKNSSFMYNQVKSSPNNNLEVNVEIKKITDIQNPYSIVVNAVHAPYDQFAIISRPGKVTIWTRKCLKRNYNPVDELSNVHELAYYLIDANSRNTVDSSYVKFVSQHQYVWGLLQEGIVQFRNFRDHSTMREINMSNIIMSTMYCEGQEQFVFYIGDENGHIHIVNENGLVMEKIKAMQCKVTGIRLWEVGSTKRILIYGSKYAVILNNVDMK